MQDDNDLTKKVCHTLPESITKKWALKKPMNKETSEI